MYMPKQIKHMLGALPGLLLLLMLSVMMGFLLKFTLDAACHWLMQQEEYLRAWRGVP